MSVKINSFDKIIRKLNIQEGGSTHAYFTELCYKKMDKFVPYRNQHLRDTVFLTNTSITYASEYASYQYFGQRKDGTHKIRKWTTPSTGPYWDKKMISADMGEIVKEVGEYIKIYGGG